MTKSFLSSLGIHLLLAILCIPLFMRPFPEHEEEKISIKFRSSEPTEQPSMMPQARTVTPPTPTIQPITVSKAIANPVLVHSPLPKSRSMETITETPISKPVAAATVTAAQPLPQPNIKAPPPPPAPPPVNVEKEYIKLNLSEIRALLIQNQQYPKQAKRLHMQGDVELHFQLNANGSVEDLKVVQSSGFELLDDDAKALILKTAPLFPKPSKNVQLRLPISYVLR